MMNKHNSFPVTAPFIIANHLMQNNQSQISENKTSYINLPTEVMHKWHKTAGLANILYQQVGPSRLHLEARKVHTWGILSHHNNYAVLGRADIDDNNLSA